MSAGTYSSFATTTDGHVFVWGLNNYGQLGLSMSTPAVFAPTLVPALRHATIAAGQHHTLAVMQVVSGHIFWRAKPVDTEIRSREELTISGESCA